MKQFLRILALGLYLVASTGLYVHFHYCGGELSHVGLFSDCSTPCCGDENGVPDCCETVEMHFGLDDEHRLLSPIETPHFASTQAAVVVSADVQEELDSGPKVADSDRAPPLRLYALYQRWVTYG